MKDGQRSLVECSFKLCNNLFMQPVNDTNEFCSRECRDKQKELDEEKMDASTVGAN